jgi:hypothetical protein
VTSGPHPLETRPYRVLPRGLALTDDLVRIAVIAGDLVNTRRARGGEDFLRDAKALDFTVSDHPWPLPAATEDDVARARVLRDRLERVFREAAYDQLDLMLLEHPPVLALGTVEENGAPRLLVGTHAPDLSAVLTAQLALALSVFLADDNAGTLDVPVGMLRPLPWSHLRDRCPTRATGAPSHYSSQRALSTPLGIRPRRHRVLR